MKRIKYLTFCLLMIFTLCNNKAMAQDTIISNTLEYSGCDSLFFRIGVNIWSSALTLKTYLGDGTSQTDSLLPNTPARFYVGHHYTQSGVYTVKSVLLNGGIPVDSTQFIDSVNLCNILHLVSYVDHNGNCIYDAGDTYLPNPYPVEVDSAGIPIDTITSTSLYYVTNIAALAGTIYAFRVITPPAGYIVSCPANGILYDTVSGTSPTTWYMTMGFVCDTSSFDLHVWGWFSPGITGACSHVYAYEYGCSTVPNTTLTVNYSTQYAYASTSNSLTPSASGTGWVTFNLGTLAPDSAANFIINFSAVGTPVLGDTTNTTWTINPIAGDINPANNVHAEIDTIRSSFDPNEKSVSPQGNIDPGTQLEYAIGFENTGNDTAFDIHVQDTLSADLDIKTFKLVSASANITTEISTNASGQVIIKFDFPHINLLDASHTGQNTGMVVFTINAKNGLATGTVINNRAGIYFDYNTVVMTNTTVNIIGTPTGIATMTNAAKIEIYPNPVNDVLILKIDKGSYSTVSVINSIGQTVRNQAINAPQTSLNVKGLSAGIYYIRIQGESGVSVKKFVKE